MQNLSTQRLCPTRLTDIMVCELDHQIRTIYRNWKELVIISERIRSCYTTIEYEKDGDKLLYLVHTNNILE